MKSLKNKVILSAAVLIFALIATIGSTYAWFTVSNTVTIGTMSMNVQTSESLLIKIFAGETGNEAALLNATNYKATLATSDIVYAGGQYENLGSWKLSPVTAQQGSVTGTTLDAKTLSVMDIDSKVYGTTAVGNSATGHYIDVKFWVLSQGVSSEDIVLQDLSITASNTLTAQNAVVNAVKVAAWTSLVYNATTPTDPAEAAKIFGLDNDWGFVFTAGMRGYDGNTTDSIVAADKTALQALQSMYYQSGATLAANIVTPTITDATSIATLSTNIPELITVRFYIDGWDAQCTNGVLAAVFSVSFKFAIKNQG